MDVEENEETRPP